ncbi:MAG: sigma factor, partial [Planctomycetota bacterium]
MSAPNESATPPEQLLAQAQWVRDLARRLVRDPDVADDVVQEAWVAVLEHPPAELRSPRAFVATIVRRLVLQRARGEARRHRREEVSAREEALESAFDVVARASAHRE